MFGVVFGCGVALGIAAAGSLFPLRPVEAAAGVGLACLVAGVDRRAWVIIPVALGAWRAASADTTWRELRIREPRLVRGAVEILRPEGDAVVARAAGRTVLLDPGDGPVPRPGWGFVGLVRLDPLRSRADPSAFAVEGWARSRGFSARARVLGGPGAAFPWPGWAARTRRVGDALRVRARERLEEAGPRTSGLLVALLLGDRGRLRDEDQDAFRRAGLAHVLALSGMHTGVLALGLGALLRTLGGRGRAVPVVQGMFLAVFAAWTGARVSILRACGTAGLGLAGELGGRRGHAAHALGLVAGVLLLRNPVYLQDVGFRLSFAATAVLVAAARASGTPGKVAALGAALRVSFWITVATLPEQARAFGAASLLSPLTNLAASLPASAALGWGALAALLPLPEPAAAGMARAAGAAAGLLFLVVDRTSGWPGGRVALPAFSPVGTALLTAAAIVGASRGSSRTLLRAAALAAPFWIVLHVVPRERLTVIDVGQGSAALLESRGVAILVDGGPGSYGGGPSPAFAAAGYRGRRAVEGIVLSHGHEDHAGGLPDFLTGRPPTVIAPEGMGERSSAVAAVLSAGPVRPPPAGWAGGAIRVVSPWGPAPPDGLAENDRSLCVLFQSEGFRAVLPGDAELEAEAALVRKAAGLLPADVLVAGHHGSRSSSTEGFLACVRPGLAVISCGAGNVYGHPHGEALERLRAAGARILRTDRDGTVTLTSTRRGLRIRWDRDFPGGP